MSTPAKAKTPESIDRVSLAAGRMERRQQAKVLNSVAMAKVRKGAQVPDGCGPDIAESPARGRVVQFMPRAMYPDGDDGFVAKDDGHDGRKALRHADAFDIMAAGAAKNRKPMPFTPQQIEIGRFYRDLNEKHATAGVRCSSLESVSGGSSGGGGEYIDAVLRDRARLEQLRARIGGGAAMIVRRQRQGAAGSKLNISDRRLVDMVCIEEKGMVKILAAHGWAKDGAAVKVLTQALRDALERMMGSDRGARVVSTHFGNVTPSPFAL